MHYEEETAKDPGSERPAGVIVLWVYCGFAMFLGLSMLGGGTYLATASKNLGGRKDHEVFLILGIVLAIIGAGMILFNLVPFLLKRQPSSWKFINIFLIVSMVGMALISPLLLIFPVPATIMWNREDVKAYYGVLRRGRRIIDDDDWEDEWDRPRRRRGDDSADR